MDTINTVTIPLDEYFELRKKAEMNEFLMTEFGRIDARLQELDRKYYDLKWEFDQKKV